MIDGADTAIRRVFGAPDSSSNHLFVESLYRLIYFRNHILDLPGLLRILGGRSPSDID